MDFCAGVTTHLNTGELDLFRRGVAKRKLTSARLQESAGYPDLADDPASSPGVRVQRHCWAADCCPAALPCLRAPEPHFRVLTLCPRRTCLLPPTPTRNPVAWHPGFTTLPSQGPLRFLRPAQLLFRGFPARGQSLAWVSTKLRAPESL